MHPVHSVYDGKFNTASGRVIDILNPDPESIVIEDIASALSKISRFGGHTKAFYSVAQHSILVMELAPVSMGWEALMHDAAEAYLGDVIKPLKVLLPDYAAIEERFMKVIIKKFGLEPGYLECIKRYDKLACEIEHEWLQVGYKDDYVHPDHPKHMTGVITPEQGEWAFLVFAEKFMERKRK